MTPGLTSIIITGYNHAAYLGAAIDSALTQTAPVEVVVIDDGSTDDSRRLIERTLQDCPFPAELIAGPVSWL